MISDLSIYLYMNINENYSNRIHNSASTKWLRFSYFDIFAMTDNGFNEKGNHVNNWNMGPYIQYFHICILTLTLNARMGRFYVTFRFFASFVWRYIWKSVSRFLKTSVDYFNFRYSRHMHILYEMQTTNNNKSMDAIF